MDWTYFKRRIYIENCTKEDLFKKWATPKGLTEWFIAEATYEFEDGKFREPNEIVHINDRYTWKFHKGSTVSGKVLNVKENALFKFTFGKKEPDADEDVIVTVSIDQKDGRCYFDILQENMASSNYGKINYYISCNMGWMFHMNNLKSLYETGHDLRVTGENRMHVDAPSGYPLDHFKWTEFKQKEFINASREFVFNKWVVPKNITGWFVAEAVYRYDETKIRKPDEKIRTGDRYKWIFFQGIEVEGTILNIIENEFLSFTFGKKEPGSDEHVIVDIFFSSENDSKTIVELHQKNISDSEYGQVNYTLSCMIGWCYFLTNLRSVFESGYDLREKKKDLALESQKYTLDR